MNKGNKRHQAHAHFCAHNRNHLKQSQKILKRTKKHKSKTTKKIIIINDNSRKNKMRLIAATYTHTHTLTRSLTQ